MTFHNAVFLSSVDVIKTKTGLAATMYAILGIALVSSDQLISGVIVYIIVRQKISSTFYETAQ